MTRREGDRRERWRAGDSDTGTEAFTLESDTSPRGSTLRSDKTQADGQRSPFPLRAGAGVLGVVLGRQALTWPLGRGQHLKWGRRGRGPGLVEGPPAVLGVAEAGDLDVLDGELVVVGDLLVDVDVLLGVDDDLLLRLHRDHLGVAVGLWAKGGDGEQRTPGQPPPPGAHTEPRACQMPPMPTATGCGPQLSPCPLPASCSYPTPSPPPPADPQTGVHRPAPGPLNRTLAQHYLTRAIPSCPSALTGESQESPYQPR